MSRSMWVLDGENGGSDGESGGSGHMMVGMGHDRGHMEMVKSKRNQWKC
jgi:hypothetical protein